MNKTYIEEAKERWGDTAAWKEFEKRPDMSKETGGGLMKLFAQLGEMKKLPPGSNEVQTAVADIQRYINNHFYECSDEVFAGLGEMYVSDERFKKNIDKTGGDGTAEFARAAIRVKCGNSSEKA
ncbi:MAG: TipAS antibiotic-recognition domain-containing protein [Clostridiales bacterium]|nr:TipAS antibiotic-recognition domain-containing protein [Clostridiales bacterium]